MKRQNNVYDAIFELKNLYLAYYKASKSKLSKLDVISFKKNLMDNLTYLMNIFVSEDSKEISELIGNYHYFTIYEPKERLICAASFPERVLHHAIINICGQNFEDYQIFDSYATRKNKGQYKAIDRVKNFIQLICTSKTSDNTGIYYAKLDVRKYFDSIDHTILKNLLRRRFKDKQLLSLFDKIIDSYSVQTFPKLETLEKLHKGIPIGNLTSQYFANFYLAYADRYAKQVLKIKSYVRYMDDIIILDNDKNILKNNVLKLEQYIEKSLSLHLKPKIINSVKNGVPFLGYRIFKNKILLLQKSKQRFLRKLKKYYKNLNTGKWTQSDFKRHIIPLYAFIEKAETKNFKRVIIRDLEPC